MSKPYFIELYSSQNNTLINKYKFVLQGQTVKAIKDMIIEKLISKNHIKEGQKVSIKDNDQFELGSDDQVNDVIPDGKVKLYVSKLSVQKSKDIPIKPQNKQDSAQKPLTSNSETTLPSKTIEKDTSKIDSSTMPIDLQSLSIPEISSDSTNPIMSAIFPQIRKSVIKIQISQKFQNFLDFSSYITKYLNLHKISPELKAIIYSQNGIPFIFNLDFMLTAFPQKLDFKKQVFYIIFTKTVSSSDSLQSIATTLEIKNNPISLKFVKSSTLTPLNFTLSIDLSNTVSTLKNRVFQLTKIHPSNQILKFGTNTFINDLEILATYNLQENSIIQIAFKQNSSNIIPASLCDKFYYKDTKMINQQSQLSIESFRSNMIILSAHIKAQDRNRILLCLQKYSNNLPLVYALKTLFEGAFLSQVHRIALEQGLFGCILQFIKSTKNSPSDLNTKDVFTFLRNFLGFIFQSALKISNSANQQSIKRCYSSVNIQETCTFTLSIIRNPRLVKIDDGQVILVDRDSMHEQIDKGFTFDYYKKPKKEELKTSSSLENIWEVYMNNHLDNSSFTMVYWIGRQCEGYQEGNKKVNSKQELKQTLQLVTFPDLSSVDNSHFLQKINTYPNLNIHEPLQIKNKTQSHLLLRTKQNRLRVFVSKNKDISKPYNIFDTITGNEQAVNLDLMSGATGTQNTQVPIDIKELKPVITREPKQAIVVLFDISGSMSCKYFNEPDLIRIGAVKSFFQAFAYRTIAYNLQHVVSLIFFDNKIQVQCDFTEAIYDFNRLISDAKPRGSTRLYDSIIQASQQLAQFGKKYPECKLRILALTDGQDTASTYSYVDAAKALIKHKIIIDSFAVGASCEGLKNVTFATGGKCYLTRSLEESLKLFQQETVLSVRNRTEDQLKSSLSIEQLLEKAKYKPFDQVNGVHKFKMPSVKAANISRQDIVKRLNNEQQVKKMSGSGSLKRISKQIQEYMKDPHPFISIYPCQDIHMWKMLLVGPKDTPYENGLFLMYAKFQGDYPFRAPQVRFTTPIYHCNMNSQGRICHSVFDRNYTPALKMKNIMQCVYGLILTPEPEDPLDNVVASFYLSDYQTYLKNAKEATVKNASQSIQNLVEELYGFISDDIERQKKINELQTWINEAKSHN